MPSHHAVPPTPAYFRHAATPLLFLTNILALAIGPQHRILQHGFSLPVLTVLAAQSLYREYSGAWGIHYAVNCGVMSGLATYVDCVVLKSADREAWTKLGSRVGLKKGAGGLEGDGPDGFPRDDGSVVKSRGVVKGSGNMGANGRAGAKESLKRSAPTAFTSRLWWAVRLACTNRYTGWSCEVKNVPIEVDDSYPRW